jgi:hypothetical protein
MAGMASSDGRGEIDTGEGVWVLGKWSNTGFGGRACIVGGAAAAYIIRTDGEGLE